MNLCIILTQCSLFSNAHVLFSKFLLADVILQLVLVVPKQVLCPANFLSHLKIYKQSQQVRSPVVAIHCDGFCK